MSISFYREREFKDTEIGRIPREWEVVRLGEISDIIMGQSPPSSTYNKEGMGLPFLQGKMEFRNMYPSPIIYCSNPLKVVEANDILISVRAPVGDVNLAPYKLCIGRGLAAIRFNHKFANFLFYFYYLQKIKNLLEVLGKGSTFKAIVKGDLENLRIPSLPYSEQQKIAETLSTVDETIQKTNEIIAKTERLKKGLMQELLTKGIGHKEFKDTEIGRIPREWEVIKIEEIASTSSGGTPSRSKRKYFGGAIPWLKSTELRDNVIYNTEEKITEEGLQNSSAKLFPKGTLLIAMYGATAGKTGILGIDSTTNQAICAILPKKEKIFESFYLQQYIIFRRVWLISISSGGAQPNINQEIIRNFKVALPPFNEQQKIAEILSTVDKKLELLRNEIAKLERTKKGLMDLLLTGKIRVKL